MEELQDPVQLSLPAMGSPLTNLTINSVSTVQPNILLRAGIFVPEGKRCSVKHQNLDLSGELSRMEIARIEGYDQVEISGPRLNMMVDFKVWCGIVWALNKYGFNTELISLPFTEFARMCGYSSKRMDAPLRERIHISLKKLRSQTISFKRGSKYDKSLNTGLILKASFDATEDRVTFLADSSLWELYLIDHQVLLSMRVIDRVPRNQTAQCLYIYLQSLPMNTGPITFARMRERLQLTVDSVKEENRLISKNIQLLMEIGYLKGFVFTRKDGERCLQIEERCPKLNVNIPA
ncbi:RepB family plasmid replication initiator protein [Shewanella glacialipiscicola]|uniref:RepB family plasmid replication initiator protein n=1 Tax=Shewanella glacialipiscicola TaxID=614069 RepID=UPI003D7ACA39